MQPLEVNPTLAATGAQVIANGTQGLVTGTTASAAVTAMAPAGVDEVSAQAAMGFASEGVEAMALHAFAQEELARVGAAYVEIAGIYNAVDAANGATLI